MTGHTDILPAHGRNVNVRISCAAFSRRPHDAAKLLFDVRDRLVEGPEIQAVTKKHGIAWSSAISSGSSYGWIRWMRRGTSGLSREGEAPAEPPRPRRRLRPSGPLR